jgi:uncharacterized protein YfaS (alpha-2-macroglobulin family)
MEKVKQNLNLIFPNSVASCGLMAVSYKGQSFGGADNTMTVADPIVISTALPRFLSLEIQ